MSMAVTCRLSEEQLERYERDGVLFPITVFSEAEASALRSAIESIAANSGVGLLKRLDGLHLFFDWAYRLVTQDSLLNPIADILGDEILIDGTLVFYKPPHDPGYVSWHQDSVYSGWHLSPSTSAWIALTPSHQGNGCMRVIPGTHKQGSLDHDIIRDDPNILNRRGERVKMAVDESHAVDVVLRPGEMSLHQSTIIHGSNPNTSDEPRMGFIVRFVTNQISARERPLLRVRGMADCSHLTLAEPPRELNEQRALSAWYRHCGLGSDPITK